MNNDNKVTQTISGGFNFCCGGFLFLLLLFFVLFLFSLIGMNSDRNRRVDGCVQQGYSREECESFLQ